MSPFSRSCLRNGLGVVLWLWQHRIMFRDRHPVVYHLDGDSEPGRSESGDVSTTILVRQRTLADTVAEFIASGAPVPLAYQCRGCAGHSLNGSVSTRHGVPIHT